jgi:hypothetical protein
MFALIHLSAVQIVQVAYKKCDDISWSLQLRLAAEHYVVRRIVAHPNLDLDLAHSQPSRTTPIRPIDLSLLCAMLSAGRCRGQLFFQTLDIAQFPNFENLAILTGKLGRPHPRHGLVRGLVPQQRSHVLAGKAQSTKGLVVFHDHGMYFTVILVEGIANRGHHARQAIVTDAIKACQASAPRVCTHVYTVQLP